MAALGLAVLVAGTFLPWFHSGAVERHSYQAADVAGRLALSGAPALRAVLHAWVAVPLVTAVCLGLLVLGVTRTAATVTGLFATFVGTVALLAVVRSGDGPIGISPAGPATTLAGASLALAGALASVLFRAAARHHPTTARTGGHP
ncbi:hypothetical protein FNH07_20305 [Amycolatopsis bartoniae]|nr:hypothetical protein FNH07_20305 [Amycolatopsis bartoniae]